MKSLSEIPGKALTQLNSLTAIIGSELFINNLSNQFSAEYRTHFYPAIS